MPTSYETAIHIRPELAVEEVSHGLARLLPCFVEHGLEPFPFTMQAWAEGTSGVLGSTSLFHPRFAKSTGDRFWGVGFMTVPAPRTQSTLVMMETPVKPDNGPMDVWRWLLDLLEPLCDSLQADLAMANGITVTPRGGVRSGLVAGTEVAPGHVPYMLYPWMYFSSQRLSEDPTLAEKFAALPAIRTGPTKGGGWILQAHKAYSGHPPKAFIDAYAAAFSLPRVAWQGIK